MAKRILRVIKWLRQTPVIAGRIFLSELHQAHELAFIVAREHQSIGSEMDMIIFHRILVRR